MLCCIGVLVISGVLTLPREGAAADSDFTTSKIFNNYQPTKPEYQNSLLNILKNNFYRSNINTAVVMGDNSPTCNRILSILMEGLMQPFSIVSEFDLINLSPTVENDNFYIDNSTAGSSVIFLVNNFKKLFLHFAKLRQWYDWNPRAKHLIVTVNEPNDKELKTFFEECWKHIVINVGVTIYNSDVAYTYNRYLNNLPYEKVKTTNIFYDKLRNMMGYPVRAKYIPAITKKMVKWVPSENKFQFLDVDWGHSQAFFRSVNATPEYLNLTNADIRRLSNFTYRYLYWNERKFGNAELWFNGIATSYKFPDRFEKLYPFDLSGVYIIATKSGLKIPNVFKPYAKETWFLIGLSLVACTLYIHLIYKRRYIHVNAFMSSFGMFLGQHYPKSNFQSMERGVFFLWSMFSVLVLSAYQGALYRALATVSYYPEIDMFDEIPEHTDTIYIYDSLRNIVQEYLPSGVTISSINSGDFVDFMAAHPKDFYVLTESTIKSIVKRKKYFENGVPLYHMMKECVVPIYLTYFLPYGSPYLDKLNRVVLACREAGLNEYWKSEADLYAILIGINGVLEDQSKALKKLSLRTQLLAFYIWATGLLSSFFCCIYEVWSNRAREKRTRIINNKFDYT